MNDGDMERWIALWEDANAVPHAKQEGQNAIRAAMKADLRGRTTKEFTIVLGEALADRAPGFSSGTRQIFRDCFNSNVPPDDKNTDR